MSEKNIIGSVIKAIGVLNVLAREPYEFTALEISKDTEMNRSTVHRLLTTLVQSGMVVQNSSSQKYMIGPQAYHLGMAYKYHFDSDDAIKMIINDVAKSLNMNVGYSVKDGLDVISFYETEQYSDVIFGYKLGSRWPIYRGACARSVLAFHEPFDEVESLIRSCNMRPKTPNTFTDADKLISEYQATKARGYAVSDEESIIGAIGIGYPVRNSAGEVVATISVAAIKASAPDSKVSEIVSALKNASEKIQEFLL